MLDETSCHKKHKGTLKTVNLKDHSKNKNKKTLKYFSHSLMFLNFLLLTFLFLLLSFHPFFLSFFAPSITYESNYKKVNTMLHQFEGGYCRQPYNVYNHTLRLRYKYFQNMSPRN